MTNPRLNTSIDPDTRDAIEVHRHNGRFRSEAEAVRDLISRGLDHANPDKFRNDVAIFYNIDMHELVAAGVIAEGNTNKGGSSWERWNDDPFKFILKIDTKRRAALFALLEKKRGRS